MKTATKVIFLFLAFVLPVGIFVFLKLFGRNEFDVPPLYVTNAPPRLDDCGASSSVPYLVPDSVMRVYHQRKDSLTVVYFDPLSGEALNQLDRIREQTASDPVRLVDGAADWTGNGEVGTLRRCVFFLAGDTNVVMVDKRGAIRGHYIASNRDEVDRLLTEITILLRKY